MGGHDDNRTMDCCMTTMIAYPSPPTQPRRRLVARKGVQWSPGPIQPLPEFSVIALALLVAENAATRHTARIRHCLQPSNTRRVRSTITAQCARPCEPTRPRHPPSSSSPDLGTCATNQHHRHNRGLLFPRPPTRTRADYTSHSSNLNPHPLYFTAQRGQSTFHIFS